MEEVRIVQKPNKEEKSNFFSRLFFCWLNPIFWKGRNRNFELEDLYTVEHCDESQHLTDKLEKMWEQELQDSKLKKRDPKLITALVKVFGKRFALLGIFTFFEESLKIVQPIFVAGLIRYFRYKSDISLNEAYLYVAGIGGTSLLMGSLRHLYSYNISRTGMWLRISVTGLIFKKALRLSSAAIHKTTVGQIVNLMSNDLQRLDMVTIFLHYTWIPIITAVGFISVIWWQMGPSSLAGFLAMFLIMPVQAKFGKKSGEYRHKIAELADKRISIMNEILNGIRLVKMYVWEKTFADLVDDVRSAEIVNVRYKAYFQGLILGLFYPSTKIFTFCTIACYIAVGGSLTAEGAFVASTLFNSARLTLTLFLPLSLQMLFELLVTIRRVQAFLILEERDQNIIKQLLSGSANVDGKNGHASGAHIPLLDGLSEKSPLINDAGIVDSHNLVNGIASAPGESCNRGLFVNNLSVKWDMNQESNTLTKINLAVEPGKLVAVVGPVGCGKSTLLLSVLGETHIIEGSVAVGGRLAYVPQQAWVFSSSLRQNVLFGKPYNEVLYEQAINASALTKDIELLAEGDQTQVGDRGVILSGGQKARLNLARAIYQDSDIFLLDDPLSAVDSTVGRHLFDKCIQDHLKCKARVLVTHQVQFLENADLIVLLKQGSIVASGTFAELSQLGDVFTQLLRETEESYREMDAVVVDPLLGSPALSSVLSSVSPKNDTTSPLMSDGGETPIVHRLSGGYRKDDFDSSDSPVENHNLGQSPLISPIKSPNKSVGFATSTPGKEFDFDKFASKQFGSHKSAGNKGQRTSPSKRFVGGGKSTSVDNIGRFAASANDDIDERISIASSRASCLSLTSNLKGEIAPKNLLEEEKVGGSVGWKIYRAYVAAMGNTCSILMLFLYCIFVQFVFNALDWLLSDWCMLSEYLIDTNQSTFAESVVTDHPSLNRTLHVAFPQLNFTQYFYIYAIALVALVALALVRSIVFRHMLARSSFVLHQRMFRSIVFAPVSFFDRNPVGRILNRFSKDTGLMDDQLSFVAFDFCVGFLLFASMVVVIVCANPTVLIIVVPTLVIFWLVRSYYLSTSRDIKRLEAGSRSPMFSHVSAVLNGLPEIRSFGAEYNVTADFHRYQNYHISAYVLFLSTSQWFGLVIDLLCAIFVTTIAFAALIMAQDQTTGTVALSLFYAISLIGGLQWTTRQSAELETGMVSVERIVQYGDLVSEETVLKEYDAAKDGTGMDGIAKSGSADFLAITEAELEQEGAEIRFHKVGLQYEPGGPRVLQNISFTINPGEKIGIAGRTGAGKSSILSILFKLYPHSGDVRINGVSTTSMSVTEVRRNMSIIPQDPVLFMGSLRKNLDPFEEYDDAKLWNSLEQVQLKQAVKSLPDGLLTSMQEGGANFSVGQRQLVCLSRALLRRNPILVLDEATANVDHNTDSLIQETIREHFKHCTVLTVAHRLNTIMDAGRVMVLEDGKLIEFASPHELLAKENGLFTKFVRETGEQNAGRLKVMAENYYKRRSAEIEEDD